MAGTTFLHLLRIARAAERFTVPCFCNSVLMVSANAGLAHDSCASKMMGRGQIQASVEPLRMPLVALIEVRQALQTLGGTL